MKVTVCELPDDRKAFESAWEALVLFVREQQSDLVIDPNGEVLAQTSRHTPFVMVGIDLMESALAKMTYPRNVQE